MPASTSSTSSTSDSEPCNAAVANTFHSSSNTLLGRQSEVSQYSSYKIHAKYTHVHYLTLTFLVVKVFHFQYLLYQMSRHRVGSVSVPSDPLN